MTSFNNRSSKSKLGYQLLSVQAQDHLVRVQFHFDSPSSVPPPSPFRMRIFSGSACFSPSVPDYLLEAWVMHGGTLTRNKDDNRNAAYFFCNGMSDPWLRKLSARSIIVIHSNWVRDAVDENFPIPIARYVLDDYFGPPLSNLQENSDQENSDQDDSDDHDDDGSEQSQLEVIQQLLPISDINPSNTGPFSSTINQHYKRPYPSEENGGPENRLFKKARFLTPNTLTVHRASPSRPTGSVSAPPPQAQIQDRTNSHRAPFLASSNLLPAGLHMEKLMGAVKPPETPGCINSSTKTNTDLVAGILPQRIASQVGMDEANKTADIADQSGSTLVDSSSDLSLSFSSSSKTVSMPKSHSVSLSDTSNAHTRFWSQAVLSANTSAFPINFSKMTNIKAQQSNRAHVSPAPLRVSVKKFLRSVSTKKRQVSAPLHMVDSTVYDLKCGGPDDRGKQEHPGSNLDSDLFLALESKPEVTLFVAGKMYMGKQMKYLGRD